METTYAGLPYNEGVAITVVIVFMMTCVLTLHYWSLLFRKVEAMPYPPEPPVRPTSNFCHDQLMAEEHDRRQRALHHLFHERRGPTPFHWKLLALACYTASIPLGILAGVIDLCYHPTADSAYWLIATGDRLWPELRYKRDPWQEKSIQEQISAERLAWDKKCQQLEETLRRNTK